MDIEETSKKIEDMTIRGAGRIARSASKALAEYAETFEGNDLDEFLKGLDNAEKRLISTRPTAVSLFNGVKLTTRNAKQKRSLDSARKAIIHDSKEFCRMSESSYSMMAKHGAVLVPMPGKMAITICNSTAAISVLKAAYSSGKIVGVYSCETRPKRQGLITVRELAEAGVPVTLIVDSAMRYVMPNVSIAFIGTDTLESDGSVLNKIGTGLLAATARDFRVPVYACAETYKFMPASKMGKRVEIEQRPVGEIVKSGEVPDEVQVYNPVFERVPPDMITGIITEHGVIKPSQAPRVIKKYLGDI